MNNLVQFNNHNIEIINHNGQLYMSGAQIGRVIELSQSDGVAKIYNRHQDEFINDMTTTIRQGRSTVRIFNREGAWLIGMFARTSKAAEFRRWVLKVLGTTVDKVYPCGEVNVREHTRSLPSGKKEIVLSEKAKTEIGGIVKSCMAAAIREELNNFLTGMPKTEDWEVSDSDLIFWLHRWHATKNKADTLKFRQLTSENRDLKVKLAKIKQAVA